MISFKKQLIICSILVASFIYSSSEQGNSPTSNKKAETELHPCFVEDDSNLGHIFRDMKGHFTKDTAENRKFILEAASDPASRVGINKYGEHTIEVFLKMMPNGLQAWAYVEKGVITNGGFNRFPMKWVQAGETGGKLVSIKYGPLSPNMSEFKTRLQFNRLVGVYNSYHPLTPITDRNVTKGTTQGVEHQTGLILNLFDAEPQVNEHYFFLPTPDELLLKEEEIQQLLAELATGIFFYDAVPFFSLHFTRDQVQYPIIHPAYQNTLVGYFISMLDYHMKGFMNGLYFDEAFIKEWEKNPLLEKSFLVSRAVNLQEYCQKTLGSSYSTLPQLRKQCEREFKASLKMDYPATSFRLIANQEEIKRSGNLFIVGGAFDIYFALDSIEEQIMDDGQLTIETNACERMCVQARDLMPRLPMFKKHFQALSLINFFTYYFNTLKAHNKVPVLTPLSFSKNPQGCPSIFPPFPIDNSEKLETKILSLLDSMSDEEYKAVLWYLRTGQFEDEAIRAFSKELYQFAASELPEGHSFLRSFDWNKASLNLLKLCKNIDNALIKKMSATLTALDLKSSNGLLTKELAGRLIAKIDSSIEAAKKDIVSLENKMAMQDKPSLELLTKLANLKKTVASLVKDRQMWSLWSQGSLVPALDGFVVSLTTFPHGAKVYQELYKGVPQIAGGWGISLVNKEAHLDPEAAQLWEKYNVKLAKMPHGKGLLTYSSWWNTAASGMLFKIPIEDLPTSTEDDKQISLAYYHPLPTHPILNNAQLEIFEALAMEDEARFKTLAKNITGWNFQDRLGVSVLHYAASKKNPSFLKMLLMEGANVEETGPLGYSSLHYAARYGSVPCLQMLIEKAFTLINSPSQNAETPLYVAAQSGQLSCVQLLLKNGADPNLKTTMHMTPLMCAAYQGLEEVALELVQAPNIDLETTMPDGSTVLHLAVESQMEKVVGRLCEHGANASRARMDGYTPVDMAAVQGWNAGVRTILTKCPYVELNTKLLSAHSDNK